MLRGTRIPHVLHVHSGFCVDQRLSWCFVASLVEWPCKAPCALHPSLLANFQEPLDQHSPLQRAGEELGKKEWT